jgi:hypothetical protein
MILGHLQSTLTLYPTLKKHITLWEANILARQAQLLASESKHKMAIKVSTRVIDQASYIDDQSLLSRVLFVRGSALGNLHLFKEAADDFKIAAQLDENNAEARVALRKSLDFIRTTTGTAYVPACAHDFFSKSHDEVSEME